MKQHGIGIFALVCGVVALGLAVIPGIALDRPVSVADDTLEPAPRTAPQNERESEGAVRLEFKKFSVTLGGGKNDKGDGRDEDARQVAEPESEVAAAPKPNSRNRLLKMFTISAVCCSLIGLILGPISWAREKQPALSGSAMGICCLAIVWQYVVMGILIGVAIAVLLIVISTFAT
jgi:hypothetical protein